jgi:hypothetical protein
MSFSEALRALSDSIRNMVEGKDAQELRPHSAPPSKAWKQKVALATASDTFVATVSGNFEPDLEGTLRRATWRPEQFPIDRDGLITCLLNYRSGITRGWMEGWLTEEERLDFEVNVERLISQLKSLPESSANRQQG